MSDIKRDISYAEAVKQFPDFPPIIIRKIDTGLRGVLPTQRFLDRAREVHAIYDATADIGDGEERLLIGGALFRDGTTILGLEDLSIENPRTILRRGGEPYKLDIVDDEVWLIDGDEPVEEIQIIPVPEYYGKKTSRGTPMIKYVYGCPTDCLNIVVSGYCHFWREKAQCKYCSLVPNYLIHKPHSDEDLEDIREATVEALKEAGRFTSIRLVAGSDPRGERPYDNEVDEYIRVLGVLREVFGTDDVYARLVASAFPKSNLERLRTAGATSYEPHIEVWDKDIFEYVCPGKQKFFGRDYWIDSAIAAVDVFGRGQVCTQLVAGAEFAGPSGFQTVDDALESNLEGIEFFAKHGVTATYTLLWSATGSVFYKDGVRAAPLDYYIRLAQGMHDIRKHYRLAVDFNDYRRCAIHPDADISRLDYRDVSYEPVLA